MVEMARDFGFDTRPLLRAEFFRAGPDASAISLSSGMTVEASVTVLLRVRVARFFGAGPSETNKTDSSMASLPRFFPREVFAGCGSGATSSGWSTASVSAGSFFLALLRLPLAAAPFLPFVFLPPCVMVDAVVRTLSSTSAVASVTDNASDATVATDCADSRDALDPRAALARPVFFLGAPSNWLMRAKNAQPGDRL